MRVNRNNLWWKILLLGNNIDPSLYYLYIIIIVDKLYLIELNSIDNVKPLMLSNDMKIDKDIFF